MVRRLILRLPLEAIEPARLAGYAALARALDAELLAQIEEDEHLTLLANLPFITEICRSTAASRALDSHNLERQSKQLLQYLTRELQRLSDNQQLRWKLARIDATAPLQPDTDAAVLRAAPSRRYRGSRPLPRVAPHLAVVDAGDPASERALNLARQISRETQTPLLLLALPSSPWHQLDRPPQLVDAIASIAALEPASLGRLLQAWHCDLLVAPAALLGGRPQQLALPDVQLLLTP